MTSLSIKSIASSYTSKPWRLRLVTPLLVAAITFTAAPAFAVNKDMVQLETQIQDLQDAVARLQKSNDERMGVMKDLVQQSADSINKMATNLDAIQHQLQTQQEAQGAKIDQVSGQIQSLNDSLDELKARLGRLEKLTQDVQNQQQSMSASMPPAAAGAPADSSLTQPPAPSSPDTQSTLPPVKGKRGKPSAAIAAADLPATPPTSDAPQAPPADQLYKTALGDYMGAKYALAEAEFGDVIKFYPDDPLSGNSYYYRAEIDYRGGKYPSAVKNYDKVLEQYPDSNKVPVSHLHKGQALIALKQNDAGVREFRTLIQRFPNSQEAMQARSKLNGMGITITPRKTTD
jgi:TolA-binding protein